MSRSDSLDIELREIDARLRVLMTTKRWAEYAALEIERERVDVEWRTACAEEYHVDPEFFMKRGFDSTPRLHTHPLKRLRWSPAA